MLRVEWLMLNKAKLPNNVNTSISYNHGTNEELGFVDDELEMAYSLFGGLNENKNTG